MAQVDPADVGHLLAAGRLRRLQGLDEPPHLGILDRVDPALQEVVERADQDRHDRERPLLAQHILKEDHLELDRMLGPVHQLVVEQLCTGGRGDSLDVVPIGAARRPAGSRSPCRSARTDGGSTDARPPGSRRCRRRTARPAPCTTRCRRARPAEVDVRAEHAPQPPRPAGTLNR